MELLTASSATFSPLPSNFPSFTFKATISKVTFQQNYVSFFKIFFPYVYINCTNGFFNRICLINLNKARVFYLFSGIMHLGLLNFVIWIEFCLCSVECNCIDS